MRCKCNAIIEEDNLLSLDDPMCIVCWKSLTESRTDWESFENFGDYNEND